MKRLYCIKDVQTERCTPPFPAVNEWEACQVFHKTIEKQLFKEDFLLFYIGDYNEEEGYIVVPDDIKNVDLSVFKERLEKMADASA